LTEVTSGDDLDRQAEQIAEFMREVREVPCALGRHRGQDADVAVRPVRAASDGATDTTVPAPVPPDHLHRLVLPLTNHLRRTGALSTVSVWDNLPGPLPYGQALSAEFRRIAHVSGEIVLGLPFDVPPLYVLGDDGVPSAARERLLARQRARRADGDRAGALVPRSVDLSATILEFKSNRFE
jgi:hypothetical protein